MTRQDFIKSGIGLAGIIASGRAPAFMKSLIGATNTAFIKDAPIPSASEYIQDGLVAMWDGYESEGLKDLVHDLPMLAVDGFDNAMRDRDCFSLSSPSQKVNIPLGEYSVKQYAAYTYEQCIATLPISAGTKNNFLFCRGGTANRLYNENKLVTEPSTISGISAVKGTLSFSSSKSTPSAGIKSIVEVFINAELKGQITMWQNGWNNLWAGYLNTGSIGTSGYSSVKTYNLRLYSRDLSDEEIAHNCSIDTARFNII